MTKRVNQGNIPLKKIWRIMKLSSILLLITLLHVSAAEIYSQTARLSLHVQQATLPDVIKQIENQSEFLFFYSNEDIDKNLEVSVNASNQRVEDVLNSVLKNTGLVYTIKDRHILLISKKEVMNLAQQGVTITGTVVDENSQTMPGVNVVVKGTTVGVVTDSNGKYSIAVANENTVLTFSFMGYKTQELIIGNRTVVNITLEEDSHEIEEVVVTALGISRESKSIGYAIEKIDATQIAGIGQTSPALGLAGKVAGVQVSSSASGMDGTPRIVIRGISSLSNDNTPLWVINGIPQQTNRVLNESLWAPSGFNDWGNPISDMNTNDIESITVLKGAAATALYGSRASNGVILVTTKKGTYNQKGWSVNLANSTTFSRPLVLPKYQTLYGQGTGGEYEYVDGNGNGIGESSMAWGPSFIDPATGQYRKIAQYNSPIDPITGKRIPTEFRPYADNYENFYETGLDANTTLGISYVNDVSNTRMSISYNKVNDIVPNSELSRISGTINSDLKIGKRLTADLTMLMSQMVSPNRSNMGDGGVMAMLLEVPNSIDIRDLEKYKDGYGNLYSWYEGGINPYWSVYENLNTSKRNKYSGRFGLKFKVFDWLDVQGNLYNDYNITEWERIRAKYKYDDGQYQVGSNAYQETNADAAINFYKTVGDWDFRGSVGTSIRNEKTYQKSATTDGGLITPGIYNLNNSVSSAKTTSAKYEKEVQSLYGYIDFSYKRFIYLTLTGRNDWSSTLPEGLWSYFYPSVSASFIFTEAFKLNSSIFTYGKLRANWARVGNDTAPYRLLRYLNRSSDWPSTSGATVPVLRFENVLPPSTLKPEEKDSWEIGTELRFLDNRLLLDVAYYNDLSRNQIIQVETPWEAGARNRLINAGEISTQGVEIKLEATAISTKDFNWDILLNWSKNKTKVKSLYTGVDFLYVSAWNGNEVRATPGLPYGNINGFVYLEDSQASADYYGKYAWYGDLVGSFTPYGTGKVLTKDGYPVHTYWNQADLPYYVTPDWTGSIANTFRYKDWDLYFMIDMRKGGKIISTSILSSIFNGMEERTVATNPKGINVREPIASGGGIIWDGTEITTGQPNTTAINAETFYGDWNTPTTHFMYNADYIKLRELAIGYTLPREFTSKLKISKARVALIGRNLWLIKSDLPGFDPEATNMGAGNSGMGMEYAALPTVRSIGFNINIDF